MTVYPSSFSEIYSTIRYETNLPALRSDVLYGDTLRDGQAGKEKSVQRWSSSVVSAFASTNVVMVSVCFVVQPDSAVAVIDRATVLFTTTDYLTHVAVKNLVVLFG